MKIVYWNIENALPHLAALPTVVDDLGSPDVLCLQEVRIRRQDAASVSALEAALPGYRCYHALPRDPRNVTFRGGRAYGVATFVRGRWSGEVPPWDLEGRVVLVRKPGFAIINVYAVNGTPKPYFDETGGVAGDRHQLKRRFQSSVMDWGRELRQGCGVILAGDWNVSLTARDTYPRLRTEEPHARARAELNARIMPTGSSTSGANAMQRSAAIPGSTVAAAGWMQRAWITSWSRRTSPRAFARPTFSICYRGATTHQCASSCESGPIAESQLLTLAVLIAQR